MKCLRCLKRQSKIGMYTRRLGSYNEEECMRDRIRSLEKMVKKCGCNRISK